MPELKIVNQRAECFYENFDRKSDAQHQTHYCPGCGHVVIERDWYELGHYGIVKGACEKCGAKIAGHFTEVAGQWGARRQPIAIG